MKPLLFTALAAAVVYGFTLATAWWIVVAVVAGASRGQVARQTLPRRAA